MKLDFVDFSFDVMDTPERYLDFVLVSGLKSTAPSYDQLNLGARRAFKSFPKAASKIKGYQWIPDNKDWKIQFIELTATDNLHETIKLLVQERIMLGEERGIRQYYIKQNDKVTFVTRFHHAVGDFIAMMMFMHVQWFENSAYKVQKPLKMYKHPWPKIRSAYAYKQPSHQLGIDDKLVPSKQREWNQLQLEIPKDKHTWKEKYGFTYNDYLTAIVLKSMKEWEIERTKDPGRRICLWLPVNIRKNPFEGFGNGSSRLKLYNRYPTDMSVKILAMKIREQVKWNREKGVWHTPTKIPKLPKQMMKKLLTLYTKKPGSDLGSSVFSHAEKYTSFEDLVGTFSSVEVISQLLYHYGMCLAASTFDGKTFITTTWDQGAINDDVIHDFQRIILKNKIQADQELS